MTVFKLGKWAALFLFAATAASAAGQEPPTPRGLKIEPPPAPNFMSYEEGAYDIHIYENPKAKDKPKAERTVLVLGLFSNKDEAYNDRRLINPATHQPYDVIIGLGASERGVEYHPDPSLTEQAQNELKHGEAVFRELCRVILKDHATADDNAAALKSAVNKYFGGPLQAKSVDVHSNGTTVGVTALAKGGTFEGVKKVAVMGPDIGYGGQYLDRDHLAQLKQAGVNSVEVYRIRNDLVPAGGQISAALGKAVPQAKLADNLKKTVTSMLNLSVVSGQATADLPAVSYQVLPDLGGPLNNHKVENYVNLRSGFIHATEPKTAGPPAVGGVRFSLDDRALLQVLDAATPEETGQLLASFGERLSQAADGPARDKIVPAFVNELKLRLRATKALQKIDHLQAVSLKTLVARAEKFAGAWEKLPEDIRHPAKISRINGYLLDPDHDDVLILGRSEPGAPPIELDDLIVAVGRVWQKDQTPLCSLDPDADNFGGDQKCRLGDVDEDSTFALKMLRTDYLMKRIMAGLEESGAAGYLSYKSILQKNPEGERAASRFWFYPIQPGEGDIQVSSDGRLVLFAGGLQVFSEQIALTRQGLVGCGKLFAPANEAAESFTKHLEEMAGCKAEIGELESLGDMILLSRVWRNMSVKSPLLDRLARLPHRSVEVPASYPGIHVDVAKVANGELFLEGGVQFNVGVGGRSMTSGDDENMNSLRKKITAIGQGDLLSRDLTGATVLVAQPAAAQLLPGHAQIVSALGKLEAGDLDGAAHDAQLAVEAAPGDPRALAARALVRFQRGELEGTRLDARLARELDPDNPEIALPASLLLSQCAAMESKGQESLDELEVALRSDPSSPQAHLLRGQAYTGLNRPAEARAEFNQAAKSEATSAAAYANLAVVELSQGWVVKAEKLAKKAQALSPEAPEAKVALAMVKATMGHADEADKLALEVLDHPACDPVSRFQALLVRMTAAASQGQWDKANDFMDQGRKLAPANPMMMIMAAAICQKSGDADRAGQYLLMASKIAPNHPAVKLFEEKYRKGAP